MVQTKEIDKAELVARAQYFPYWEIRDEESRILRKSSQGEAEGKSSLSEWIEEFYHSKFMKLVFVRFGQGAKDAVRHTLNCLH